MEGWPIRKSDRDSMAVEGTSDLTPDSEPTYYFASDYMHGNPNWTRQECIQVLKWR